MSAATDQLDTLLRSGVERGVAPAVAAVVGTGDTSLYRGAAGSRGSTPMTPDSVVWLASMTKLVTAIAALQQVERGALTLDGPIRDVLPELADPQVLTGFDTDGRAVLRPASAPLTLRHLLNHTAGYGYEFWNADVERYQTGHDVPGILACRNLTLANPLVADPGTAWEYGPNLDWAAKAVEAVTGTDLEVYVRDNVAGPLGLSGTGFLLADKRSRLTSMNVRTPDGATAPLDLEMPQEPEFYMGGGGLYSTPDDYLRILRMLLRGGELDGARLLAADTVAEARTNHIGELTVDRISTHDPGASYDVDLLPGTTKKWSLFGMLNVEDTPAGRSAGSLFWAGLCNSYFWIDWDRDECGALFTQLLPFADPAVLTLFDEFESAVRDVLRPTVTGDIRAVPR